MTRSRLNRQFADRYMSFAGLTIVERGAPVALSCAGVGRGGVETAGNSQTTSARQTGQWMSLSLTNEKSLIRLNASPVDAPATGVVDSRRAETAESGAQLRGDWYGDQFQ